MTDEEWRHLMRTMLELTDEGICYMSRYHREKYDLVAVRNRIAEQAGLPRRDEGWPEK